MTTKLALAAAALGLAGALTACTSTVAKADVEKQIVDKLSVDKASCPDDLTAEKGSTITCTATQGDQQADVKVTVTSVDDDQANFDIEVQQ